ERRAPLARRISRARPLLHAWDRHALRAERRPDLRRESGLCRRTACWLWSVKSTGRAAPAARPHAEDSVGAVEAGLVAMPPIRAAGVERAPPLPAAARAIAIVVGIGPNDDEPPVVEAVTGEMVGAGEVRHHAMATMAAVARIRGGRRAYRRQQRQR